MNMQKFVKLISETQDGNPLVKFTEGAWNDDAIVWAALDDDLGRMSIGDALNVLLLKIVESECREDDIDYVLRQLERARPVIKDVENVESIQNLGGHVGMQPTDTCPMCGNEASTRDCLAKPVGCDL